jgi:metal-dependent hydrolase (beta-lactamase superfamily II)
MSEGTGAAKVTIIVDNKAAEGLLCEHGFSAWIESAGRRLLFDTGQGAAFAGNADKLGVDLRTVDILVLSHGHYDHTGGVPFLIARAPMPAATRTALDVHCVKSSATSFTQSVPSASKTARLFPSQRGIFRTKSGTSSGERSVFTP